MVNFPTASVVFVVAIALVVWGFTRMMDTLLSALGAPTILVFIIAALLMLLGLWLVTR